MATGGSAATGATVPSSAPPSVAGLTFGPTMAYGEYFATDPNNSHFQIGYSPSTGNYTYSNPYTGVWAQGGSSIVSAVQAYEQKYGNAPVATIQNLLAGNGVTAPKASTTPATTATSSTTSTSAAATDPVSELLADLPSLIGDNNADPASQSTQQPEVLPTTSGGGTSAASPIVPLLLIGVAIALGFWWYKTHHKGAAAHAA